MKEDFSGPAFPIIYEGNTRSDCPGMSLRDYFAAKSLQGFTGRPGVMADSKETRERLANLCYSMADAMLKARSQK